MIGLAITLAVVLSATPAERHAAFLKLRFDGSTQMLKGMRAEVEELGAYWDKWGRTGDRARALVAWKKRQELLDHFAEELCRAPVPPEIVRLGSDAVSAYKDELSLTCQRLRP